MSPLAVCRIVSLCVLTPTGLVLALALAMTFLLLLPAAAAETLLLVGEADTALCWPDLARAAGAEIRQPAIQSYPV